MSDVKVDYRVVVASALNEFIKTKNIEASQVDAETIAVQTPPNPEMGDLGVPLFVFAKTFRLAPPVIAQEVVNIINSKKVFEGIDSSSLGEFLAVGPYVNLKLNKDGIWGTCVGNNLGANAVWFDIPLYSQKAVFNFRGKTIDSVVG